LEDGREREEFRKNIQDTADDDTGDAFLDHVFHACLE
jgi:hypothetical protein